MSIRLAQRRFAPTLLATVLALAGIVLFTRLGCWQLSRAGEKQALQEQYEQGRQTLIELSAANAPELPRYQRVRAHGRYDPQRQILLDNLPSAMGQPGYRVVTPFELAHGGGWVLIDRGWRPMGRTRREIPDVAVGDQPRTITGLLDRLPQPGVRLTPREGAVTWPRVMSFPEQAALERALGRAVLPGLVLLDADQPDGYERVWEVRARFDPQRHLGYAVQWFAFAVLTIVLYVVTGLHRGQVSDEHSS